MRILVLLLCLVLLISSGSAGADGQTPTNGTSASINTVEECTLNTMALADAVNEGAPLMECLKSAIQHWAVDTPILMDALRRQEAPFLDVLASLGASPQLELVGRRETGSCMCSVYLIIKGEKTATALKIQYYKQKQGWRINGYEMGNSVIPSLSDFSVVRRASELPEAKALTAPQSRVEPPADARP